MCVPALFLAPFLATVLGPAAQASAPATSSEVEVFVLAHDSAAELAALLQPLLEDVRVVADARTHSLRVAGAPARIAAIEALVTWLGRTPERAASTTSARESPRVDLWTRLPPASGPLVIEVGGDAAPTMGDVFSAYAELTGQQLVAPQETLELLRNTPAGLLASVTVPAEHVQTFVERLLVLRDFVLLPPIGVGPPLVGLRTQQQQRRFARIQASWIDAALLEWAAKHPALVFGTTVRLENTDVRQLAQALHGLLSEANLRSIVPAHDSNSWTLSGTGSQLADFVAMLRTIDAQEPPMPREPAQALGGARQNQRAPACAARADHGAAVPGNEIAGRSAPPRRPFARAGDSPRHSRRPLMWIPTLFLAPLLGALSGLSTEAPAPAVPAEVEVHALAHHSARELAALLQPLLEDVRVIADARTNSLLVAGAPARIAAVQALVAQLDRAPGGTGPAPEAPAEARVDLTTLFPPASGPLVVEVGGDAAPAMVDVLAAYAKLSGQQLIAGQETQEVLRSSPTGLLAGVEIPAQHAQAFVERLLVLQGFVLVPYPDLEPPLLEVVSLSSPQRNTLRQRALWIDAAQLEQAAKHPAVVFSTSVRLENTDVRQLSNSLRSLLTDANLQQLIPAGASSSLILSGTGSQLADLVAMMRRIDGAEPAMPSVEALRAAGGARQD